MGRKKRSMKQAKVVKPYAKLPTSFDCPFCQHKNSVEYKAYVWCWLFGDFVDELTLLCHFVGGSWKMLVLWNAKYAKKDGK